jgi:hypothetical protein
MGRILACRPTARGPRGLARFGLAQRLGPLSSSSSARHKQCRPWHVGRDGRPDRLGTVGGEAPSGGSINKGVARQPRFAVLGARALNGGSWRRRRVLGGERC